MKRDLESIILTRQELQIMKVVWKLGFATVKDVCSALCQQKPTAYTTVLTLMGILEEKGVLVHQRSGRAYSYTPLLSQEQATRNQVQDVLLRFFDGRPEKLITSLVKSELLAPGQLLGVTRSLIPGEESQVA